MSLKTLAARHGRYRRDDLALAFGERRLTHGQVARRVNRAANALDAVGIGKGDPIALLLDISLEPFDLDPVAMKTGVIVVPVSPLPGRDALAKLLVDAEVTAIVTMPRLTDEIDAIRDHLSIADGRFLVPGGASIAGWSSYDELVRRTGSLELVGGDNARRR